MDIDGFALVTGGASGIGKASCHALAQEGASGVMVADLNLDGARETAAALESVATHPDFRAEAVQVDVSQEDSVRAAISRMVELFGRIDYSVHSAGVPGGASDPIAAASFPDFKRLLELNVHGAFLVTSLISAAMKSQEPRPVHEKYPERGTQRGVIVNLASISSYITLPHMVQYNTSKHAVLAITKTAAIDNVANGIRVNCICPTWTDTPMVKEATQVVTGLEQRLLVGIPMGRLCRPEEVADTVLYLCSHRSSFTTGAGIIMDGGMSLSCKT
ncbi:NAD(P)-binding protein [Apiospora saccharicola]|uniref:NAD(P)-binding protein n=1 Tax=Apiospora saccharicola TaxID=335842 RepID=A0ABR1UE98_9PEZI